MTRERDFSRRDLRARLVESGRNSGEKRPTFLVLDRKVGMSLIIFPDIFVKVVGLQPESGMVALDINYPGRDKTKGDDQPVFLKVDEDWVYENVLLKNLRVGKSHVKLGIHAPGRVIQRTELLKRDREKNR